MTKVSEPIAPIQGLCIGRRKGFQTNKLKKNEEKVVRTKKAGKVKHNKFIRDVVREVVGFSPYERRAMELIKAGKDKRTLKFLKKRLGGHLRGKKKRDELQTLLQSKSSKA